MNDNAIIACRKITKTYQDGKIYVEVIKNLTMTVAERESVAIVGASGSGKTTLLQLLGGLDNLSGGQITVMGKDLCLMTAKEQGRWRNRHLGFIYQFHHLLPEFSAAENVMMPLLIAKIPRAQALDAAVAVLTQVGLKNRINHRPGELSGGEKQRVSVARALVNNPDCILADEPTGNLDKKNAHNIMSLLLDLKDKRNLALVTVTHDESLVSYFDRVLLMSDGHLKNQ